MKKIIIILAFSLIIAMLPSCSRFDINEAASFSHKCPSKHAKRLHRFNGKLFYSLNDTTTIINIAPTTKA